MKFIKNYNSYNESLKPSQFREYVDVFDKERYADIFKKMGDDYQHDRNYYRVYIPLKINLEGYFISDTHELVGNFLNENDYEVIDYIKGTAKFKSAKNTTTIGKILTKLKNDELLKLFISDELRKSIVSLKDSNLLIVISRHPYDIAGSDTDRDWTNCMTIGTDKSNRLTKLMDELTVAKKRGDQKVIYNLENKIRNYKKDGSNVSYLIHEVKQGSLVAYLTTENDKNIESPLGVLNIKPYVKVKEIEYNCQYCHGKGCDYCDNIGVVKSHTKCNGKGCEYCDNIGSEPLSYKRKKEILDGERLLQTSRNMYGSQIDEFKEKVDSILDKYFNKDIKGIFKLSHNVYNDQDENHDYKIKK